MKKFLLTICLLLLFIIKVFSQQFSQYNTGTVYDSFENPSQRSFIPDSSKQYASNFFIPSFNANFYFTGNSQATAKSRVILGNYNNTALSINPVSNNHASVNVNAYVLMLKTFASLNGDEEMGISVQSRAEGKGLFSDASIALLNGTEDFKNTSYSNIFNNNFYYQAYNQVSFSYRERFTKKLAFGIKISGLLGVQYEKLNIRNSSAVINSNDDATVALQGNYQSNYIPGHLIGRDYLPTLRNPGAGISIGASYRTDDGFIIQTNIKDLGFIHWSSRSSVYNFDSSTDIKGLLAGNRQDNVYNAVHDIIRSNEIVGSFTTPINGTAEVSVNHIYWIDDDKQFKYSPTLVAAKDLYYTGFTGAWVNPVQYRNCILTLTATYDDLKLFNLGTQFMYKSSNLEAFIGTDKLLPTISLGTDALSKSSASINKTSSFTGADVFIGFALKFGQLIEHPMNASTIPTGDKGFLARLYNRFFKTNN